LSNANAHSTAAVQSTPGVQLLGVNLSGAEDGNPVTGVMNYNYVYPTTSEIDYFASLGLNTIRIPVAWQRLQPTEGGALSTTQIAQLQTLVAYAATKGMTVDIDLHNYGAGFGADVGTTQTPDSAFANFWGQMAETFKNSPNVIFGLMNEPNSQTPAAWAVAAQDAVNAIRATGASQEILVSGSDWDTASSWISSGNAATVGAITDPDNNVVFEVHQYFDQGSSGTTTNVLSPDIGPQSLAAVTQWAEENGKKLFLGEFGNGSDPASLTAESNTLNYLNANSSVWQGATYWAGGPWMGSYMFSADPQNGVEAPQTAVLAAAAAGSRSIAIFSATSAVTTTDAATATPFSGVILTGANAAQNTTATVTLGSTVHGALSDPNATTDGSKIVNGVWTMTGSSLAVAAALDELAFKPAANLTGPAGAVATTVTAVVAEGGETASTTSTITVTGYAATSPITITPTTKAVATTDASGAKPFAGVVITDANAGQTEAATVTLSAAANGILSDPNARTDGSTITNGVWTISGSSTAVAVALDGLVFTPTDHQVAPGGAVTTTLTAAIKDTAGEKAVASSTITATAVAAAITMTPATDSVHTSGTTSAKPFTGVAITDVNAGQTETATVTPSAAGNGTLSDPNSTTDGTTVANNVLTVSGSPTAVAAALNGLVFKPINASVSTTLTATIRDTAGETASASSTITATQVAVAPTAETIVLNMSESYADGDAEFTVSVNGQQVGGDYQAHGLNASGDAGSVSLTGDWGSGVNDVQVSFINHAYGRNLYVNSISENGVTYAGTSAALPRNGTDTFAVGGTTATAAGPADTLTLQLSEDAWAGNALFVLYIDGHVVTTPQVVTALQVSAQTQSFTFSDNLGAGTHTIGLACVNASYGPSAGEQRNLFVNGIELNGSDVFSGNTHVTNGIASFTAVTTH
jgi:endoglucanase